MLQTWTVRSRDVIEGRCDLRAYPYNHITVQQYAGREATDLMYIAEMLAPLGWELVSIANVGDAVVALAGYFRRVRPA